RTDAALVDHVVESLRTVDGGLGRADVLAGRLLAVHARHRLEVELGGGLRRPGAVVVDAEPVHLPPPSYLLLAHHGDVVLRLAGDHAGAAADAGRQVDGHAPAVFGVGIGVIHRERRAGVARLLRQVLAVALGGEGGFGVVLRQGAGADHGPIF